MKRTCGKVVLVAALFTGAAAPARLQLEISRLNSDPVLAHGTWGFCVMTVDSGKIIASHNPGLSLIPASTMKVLTTGAALGLLGTDFRYETKLEYDGVFDTLTGTIKGNLYIRGSGDPTVDSKHYLGPGKTSDLAAIAKQLAERNVTTIEGDIIGDASCFSENPLPDGWTWSDIGQYYGAGASGLAYRDNSVTLHFNSAKGDSCILEKTVPQTGGIVYRSYVKADGRKDEAFVYGAPYGEMYYIYGSIPAMQKDYEVDASHPEPAFQFAEDLRAKLEAQNIKVSGKTTTVRRMSLQKSSGVKKRMMLFSHLSPPLSSIVQKTNTHSDNVYAEQLLRTLGLLKGKGGTTEAGTEVVIDYWKTQGVNVEGLFMTDGSGLSRSNAITPFQQASILQKISRTTWFDTFDKSLPVAGKNGSMTGLCKGTCAENNLRAKTGYINRARGYTGYVKTKGGKLLCFSLLANNYTCSPTEMKRKLEKLLVAMAELE